MKFEGTQVNIPIKGIMRAGTYNLSADGAMNEVVGMEFKDGSWLPYKENVTADTIIGTKYIVNVFVHKTSDGQKHNVYLSADGDLYIAPASGTLSTPFASGVKDVSFIGNMLCAASAAGIDYYLWKGNTYAKQTSDSCPQVEFRVLDRLWNDNTQENNVKGLRYLTKILQDEDNLQSTQTAAQALVSESTSKESIIGNMSAALGEVRDRGGLTGYFLVCAAYRNKEGQIVGASAPKLMCRPSFGFGKLEENTSVDRPTTLSSNYGNRDNFDDPSNTGTTISLARETNYTYSLFQHLGSDDISFPRGTSLTKEGFQEVVPVDNNGGVGTKDGNYLKVAVGNSVETWGSSSKNKPFLPPLACTKMQVVQHRLTGGWLVDNYFHAYASCNMLQYRIPSFVRNDNSDIQSICIFMSEEVYPYDLSLDVDTDFNDMIISGGVNNLVAYSQDENLNTCGVYAKTYFPKEKEITKVIDELKKLKSFYLIEEISVDDITAGSTWINLNLKGMLGDALVTRETLPMTAFGARHDFPEHLSSYNYRLHQYDYKQELFAGYSIPDFFYFGSYIVIDSTYYTNYRQFPGENMDSATYKWEIEVELDDEEGNSKVVKYNSVGVSSIQSSLSPFLSYPSIYAKSMKVSLYKLGVTPTALYTKTFTLTKWNNLGMAVYVDENFKPIILSEHVGYVYGLNHGETVQTVAHPTDLTPSTPVNNIRTFRNGLKISDVSLPMYFPTEFTYRIGNENIIGVARLTTPVSQDNFGQSALVIFCGDGIYSLRPDTSGNGAYSTIDFVSPEVCVNRNSICEIGGSIFFAGEKGLMVVTGNGNGITSVTEYSHHLNGVPKFLPSDEPGAKGIYNEIVTNEHILNNGVGNAEEDFIDYIKSSGTNLVYISNKNKLLAYNGTKEYSYFIDIPTGNTTALHMAAICDDGNNIGKKLYENHMSPSVHYDIHTFGYNSETGNVPCLIQSRPIKIQQDDKCSYRFVITGYFNGANGDYAELVVFGSLDGDNWRAIGAKEKKLYGGFHNFGCLTERGSWKYLMFIFGGKLSSDSHIDSIDVTVNGKYNNKKR